MANQARSPVGAGENTTGLRRPSNAVRRRPVGPATRFTPQVHKGHG
jgi:hypothetical protein